LDYTFSGENDDETTLLSFLPSKDPDPGDLLEKIIIKERVDLILSELSEEYRDVISMLFGLGNYYKPLSIALVEKRLGIGYKKISKIRNNFFKEVREKYPELKDFL
jgi:DNA-directed RNA polymerase sigma subunit (sigma70/sigma32)